ncbi:MAG: hypothetical protein KAJ29_07590 [Alphaproteobacteria bacterium]|nr:hypothetical protein [Alphaproteobacteria bacterium]
MKLKNVFDKALGENKAIGGFLLGMTGVSLVTGAWLPAAAFAIASGANSYMKEQESSEKDLPRYDPSEDDPSEDDFSKDAFSEDDLSM